MNYFVSVRLATVILLLSITSALSIRFPDRVKDRISHSRLRFSHSEASGGPKRRSDACTASCAPPLVTAADPNSTRNTEVWEITLNPLSIQILPIEYDQKVTTFRQLLEVFWTSHDSRQVFGQRPDVGNQYRIQGCCFQQRKGANRSKNIVVTTQIQQLGTLYRAEAEHQIHAAAILHLLAMISVIQASGHVRFFPNKSTRSSKFVLKLNPFLQSNGKFLEEELQMSVLATKLNGCSGSWSTQDTKASRFKDQRNGAKKVARS